jgi:hypothetical protein
VNVSEYHIALKDVLAQYTNEKNVDNNDALVIFLTLKDENNKAVTFKYDKYLNAIINHRRNSEYKYPELDGNNKLVLIEYSGMLDNLKNIRKEQTQTNTVKCQYEILDEDVVYGEQKMNANAHNKLLDHLEYCNEQLEKLQAIAEDMANEIFKHYPSCTALLHIQGEVSTDVIKHKTQITTTRKLNLMYCMEDPPKLVKETDSQAGGKTKNYVLYNNRKYLVRKENRKSFILVQKNKQYLCDIKNKYKKC